MARQSRASASADRRREEVAFRFLATGAAFVIVPLFLPASPLGKSLSALIPLGLVMLAIGAIVLFLGRKGTEASARAMASAQEVRALPTGLEAPEVDRAFAEFERARGEVRAVERTPRAKPSSWGPEVFEVIEWRRFEAVVEALFQQAGLETKSHSHGADGGVDVWLYSRKQPEEPVGLVQCKHWSEKQVGVEKIRELRGVMAAKKVGRGIFATTSSFTADAMKFGHENAIDLLDVDRLLALIGNRTPEQEKALLDVALEGDYARPTCVNCGIKMVERTARKGGNAFWGCRTFPECRATLAMRDADKRVDRVTAALRE